MKTVKHNQRTSRVRSLIQLGGLLHKAGLDKMFAIELGEDLQSAAASLDKAATLLGCLMEIQAFVEERMVSEREPWKETGTKALKGKALDF